VNLITLIDMLRKYQHQHRPSPILSYLFHLSAFCGKNQPTDTLALPGPSYQGSLGNVIKTSARLRHIPGGHDCPLTGPIHVVQGVHHHLGFRDSGVAVNNHRLTATYASVLTVRCGAAAAGSPSQDTDAAIRSQRVFVGLLHMDIDVMADVAPDRLPLGPIHSVQGGYTPCCV